MQRRGSPRGTHRVAVVGAGYFSQFHLQGWTAMKDVALVGLCDTNKSRAEALAQRFGVMQVFDRLDDMLDACEPDLLDVVTPPQSHAPVVHAALEQHIPVICQKPFSTDYGAARALAAAADAAGVPLVVHENFRFMPWFREAKRWMETGAIGTPHGISFRLRPGDGQGPAAYLDRQPYFQTMPRLLVTETAIHLIDTFRFLLGEVTAVQARLRRLNPSIQGEDAALITLEFGNGATGLFDGNRLNDHVADNPRRTMGEMWLEGSAGILRLDGNARLWWKPHHGPEAEHVYDCGDPNSFGGGACAALQQHVLLALSQGRQPQNTASDYLRNLHIQQAVYASHHRGQRIVVNDFDPLEKIPAPFSPAQSKETS